MKLIPTLLVILVVLAVILKVTILGGTTVLAEPGAEPVKTTALSNKVKDIDGKEYDLSQLKGKVVMIVNVASRCGNTPQYKGLETIYKKYADKGFVIVGFPSNDFMGQEPGSDADIKAFCTSKYDVTFPMMSKVVVKGDNKSPVYKALTEGTGPFAGDIDWNFAKFLINKDGQTIAARFKAGLKPEDLKVTTAIETALAK